MTSADTLCSKMVILNDEIYVSMRCVYSVYILICCTAIVPYV